MKILKDLIALKKASGGNVTNAEVALSLINKVIFGPCTASLFII